MNKINSTIFFTYLNQFVSILFGIIMVPFYIEQLGLDVYGYIALFSLFGIVVSNLDFGIFSSINKELASSINDAIYIKVPSVIGLIEGVILVILFFLIITFSILFFVFDFLKSELILVIFIISVWGSVKLLDNLYRQVLFGLQRQKYHSQLNIFLTFIKAISIYLLLRYVNSHFIYYIIGTLIPIVIGTIFFRNKIKKKINYFLNFNYKSINKKLIEVSKKFFLINVLGQILLQIDKIVVYIFSVDMNTFGFYALGLTVASMVLKGAAPIQQYLFSKLPSIHKQNNIENSFNHFNESFKIIFLILFLLILSFPIFVPKLLEVWLGDFGTNFNLFFQIYIVFISYVILTLLNLNVLYLQVTISPKKGIQIISFSILTYLLLSIVFYAFDNYNPLFILFSSYFLGYLYSKYILIKQLKKHHLKNNFLKWEIVILFLSLVSIANAFFNEKSYAISLKSVLNNWYLSSFLLLIVSLLLLVFLKNNNKLIK